MPENRISEGGILVLENATAASNIVAGTLVAVNTASNAVYSFCRDTVSLNTAGSFGIRCIGVLDEDVSAGQCPVVIRTKGIYEFRVTPGETGVSWLGCPVFGALSGGGLTVALNTGGTGAAAPGNVTGSVAIGTIVGLPSATANAQAGDWIKVKIRPGAFMWGGFSAATGTGQGDCFPVLN